MGETVRYVAHHRGQWLALVVFSAPALKCAARDRWIGWDYAVQFDRLHLLTNNSRFLLLPGAARNLGSRVLSLCTRRLVRDWPVRFGHALLLVETFVDPARFHGTVYRKLLPNPRRNGSLSDSFTAALRVVEGDNGCSAPLRCVPCPRSSTVDDPRRRQGRRHAHGALATAATLCGMRGYKAISNGSTPRPQGAGALRRSQRPLPPPEPLGDAQRPHSRRPRSSTPLARS